MAHRSANITATDSVRTMRAACLQFAEDVNEALILLELESRRAVDWIENDRSRYWPAELRKASDRLGEARIALERCELSSTEGEHHSCMDERKALQKAKDRLRTAEAKVQAVQRWRGKIRKEVEEFHVQCSRMKHYLDTDLLRAVAMLERMSTALERYIQQASPAATGDGAESAAIVSPRAESSGESSSNTSGAGESP